MNTQSPATPAGSACAPAAQGHPATTTNPANKTPEIRVTATIHTRIENLPLRM
jgi:hypothetical protein